MSESDWRSERVALKSQIEKLRQEVQLLQVEKSSLEKVLPLSFNLPAYPSPILSQPLS